MSETDTRPTLAERISADGLKMSSRFTHLGFLLCKIRGFDREMVAAFTPRQGEGQVTTIEDVLNCLLSDAATYLNARGYEDWCEELGYEPEEDSSRGTWELVKDQTDSLTDLLGEHYDDYLWHTSSVSLEPREKD